jgi:hypothetical protein
MTQDERRVLQLLAENPDGCTDALLLAYGFPLKIIDGILGSGLATATAGRAFVSGRPVDAARLRITDAGLRALADRGDKSFL